MKLPYGEKALAFQLKIVIDSYRNCFNAYNPQSNMQYKYMHEFTIETIQSNHLIELGKAFLFCVCVIASTAIEQTDEKVLFRNMKMKRKKEQIK